MTSQQVELIRNSWKYVTENVPEAGEIFYRRLFEVNPQVKTMFKADVKEQSRKLVAIISFAVKKLNNLDEVIADVQALGRRHDKYGVESSHYPIVAESLLGTLEKGLGELFTEELKDAWVKLYMTLADIMINASRNTAAQKEIVS